MIQINLISPEGSNHRSIYLRINDIDYQVWFSVKTGEAVMDLTPVQEWITSQGWDCQLILSGTYTNKYSDKAIPFIYPSVDNKAMIDWDYEHPDHDQGDHSAAAISVNCHVRANPSDVSSISAPTLRFMDPAGYIRWAWDNGIPCMNSTIQGCTLNTLTQQSEQYPVTTPSELDYQNAATIHVDRHSPEFKVYEVDLTNQHTWPSEHITNTAIAIIIDLSETDGYNWYVQPIDWETRHLILSREDIIYTENPPPWPLPREIGIRLPENLDNPLQLRDAQRVLDMSMTQIFQQLSDYPIAVAQFEAMEVQPLRKYAFAIGRHRQPNF